MFGLLNLHKPPGLTSRAALNQVQRIVRPTKVGHAGTLDPIATGVLIATVGPATRLTRWIQEYPKTYQATFLLGRVSDTEDVTGQLTEFAATAPTDAELALAAQGLLGTTLQKPPAYSALKVAGKRAYALARSGQPVELVPRPITVYRLEIRRYDYPRLELEIECSSGTYVRSLGRDLAAAAGTGAVMESLVRTAIGPFTLSASVRPDHLTPERIGASLLPAGLATGSLVPYVVPDEDIERLRHGGIMTIDLAEEELAAFSSSGELLAILARRESGHFRPVCNFLAAQFSPS